MSQTTKCSLHWPESWNMMWHLAEQGTPHNHEHQKNHNRISHNFHILETHKAQMPTFKTILHCTTYHILCSRTQVCLPSKTVEHNSKWTSSCKHYKNSGYYSRLLYNIIDTCWVNGETPYQHPWYRELEYNLSRDMSCFQPWPMSRCHRRLCWCQLVARQLMAGWWQDHALQTPVHTAAHPGLGSALDQSHSGHIWLSNRPQSPSTLRK